ncbi:uncharacterized protein METZ01_LOCUS24157 [marine metagenome]|uniref:Uncharacterized protein n=1 Tax=marine metagenome TaxID=408172 RepID=A0A381Q101_9ZZZZ
MDGSELDLGTDPKFSGALGDVWM